MKLVYNPLETGAPIKGFVWDRKTYNHPVGKILQYEVDEVAVQILATFGFLQNLTRADVDGILKKQVKKEFACKYCEFSHDKEIALRGHMRSHKDKIDLEERPLDEKLVAKATGEEAVALPQNTPQMQRSANPGRMQQQELSGDETTSSDFYGEGFQEKKGT